MIYHVHSVEQDLAGKWYARVVISDNEAVFLKFEDFPSMGEIQDGAEGFVVSRKRLEDELAVLEVGGEGIENAVTE